jgi:hypothetical protein
MRLIKDILMKPFHYSLLLLTWLDFKVSVIIVFLDITHRPVF